MKNIDILNIRLRQTTIADLDSLFDFQLDKQARYLAAFTNNDSTGKSAYLAKYTRLLVDKTVNNQTILLGDLIVGSVAKFMMNGDAEITYWLDKKF